MSSGEYGIVYKGKLSEGFNTGFSQIVAVKTLKGVLSEYQLCLSVAIYCGWLHYRISGEE